MRAQSAGPGALRSRLQRHSALLPVLALGCSALLHDEAAQCRTDGDCERLGFSNWTCDTPRRVCIAPTVSGGGGEAGGAPSAHGGATGVGGRSAMGEAGEAGEAGAGRGGEAQAGADPGGESPTGGSAASGAGAGGVPAGGALGAGAGTGGASAGAGGSGSPPIPDWTPLAPAASGSVWLRVRSFCAQPLWLRAMSPESGPLSPDNAKLETNAGRDFKAPGEWLTGQVLAYGSGPGEVLLHSLSLSVSSGVSYFGLQYIEQFALPVEISAYGGSCTSIAHTRRCAARESAVSTCPEAFLKGDARCASPSSYCLAPPNQNAPYCHALDTAIKSCSGCPAGSTLDVYAGTGAYATEARLAAALNRGMTAKPDSKDQTLFYQQPPFNTYAKWLHGLCPTAIAFSHDDFGAAQTPYPACTASEIRITFCPAR